VIATPSLCGEPATWRGDWRGFKTRRGRVDRGDFPPSERRDVISLASSTTDQQDCPATRWALDDLAATLINQAAHAQAMSRSTIWRILDEADLKPHRSVSWLNSHDPDFDTKAQAICKLYVEAPVMYQLVFCKLSLTPVELQHAHKAAPTW
jgi:hypothetical protein